MHVIAPYIPEIRIRKMLVMIILEVEQLSHDSMKIWYGTYSTPI